MTGSPEANRRLRAHVADIVARASFMRERQDTTTYYTDVANISEATVQERLDRLLDAVAGGDRDAFNRWLQWNELDIAGLRRGVQDIQLVDPETLPSWGETICAVVEARSSPIADERDAGGPPPDWRRPCLSPSGELNLMPLDAHHVPGSPIPFQEAFSPALRAARGKLLDRLERGSEQARGVSPLTLISAGAYASLESSLLERLSYVCAPSLGAEFARTRPVGARFLIAIDAADSGAPRAPASTHYWSFVRRMLADGLLSLFERYPMLARFVAIVIDQWVDATVEFLERLRNDLAQIEQVLRTGEEPTRTAAGANPTLGLVTAIEHGLSDAHHSGRSTLAVTFESGLRVVYKPKSLRLEQAYVDLLRWCNRKGLSLNLMSHKVLDCDTHGWAEFVAFTPCHDEGAVSRFYRRAGMQLCLLYVLGASDCHAENLIACGEHLILVDMETLLSAEPSPIGMDAELGPFDSVLRTGLLPRWECHYDTQFSIDVSGLGFVEAQPFPDRQWAQVNTDTMHLAWEDKPAERLSNIPVRDEAPQTPTDHVDELVDGFMEMYRCLMVHRDTLVGPDGPVAAMAGLPMRFIFRPTFVYLRLREQALAPAHMRSGVELSIHLANLSRAFVAATEKPVGWPILAAEVQELEQLDVPYFGLKTDDKALTQGVAEPLRDYFAGSALDECVARIQRLSVTDMELQAELIRGAVYCGIADVHAGGLKPADAGDAKPVGRHRHERIDALTTGSLLEAARLIAEGIQQRSIRVSADNLDWLGLNYSPKTDRMQVDFVGDNLFDGRCGIALFLAAYARTADEPTFRELALEALHPLRRSLHADTTLSADELVKAVGIGGATGLGSMIYSLLTVGRLLEDVSVIAEAHHAVGFLGDRNIEQDAALDVVNGAAGAALSLLALHRESGDSESLRLARRCGEHLLETGALDHGSASRRRGSAVFRKPGFAHGIAGVWYALLRLYEVTREHAFLRAAQEMLNADLAQDLLHNDRYSDIPPPLLGTWCNGIPGIGLARLGGLSMCKSSGVEEQIEEALRKTESWPLYGVDHVCCGNFGRIEVLLVASDRLARPRLQVAARETTARVVDRAMQARMYQLQGESFSAPYFDPSFFHGAAGIGYGLLRVAYPETLPCVLLWE